MTRYYIADLRAEWTGTPYVTFWRPDSKGYAYPLCWSGQYLSDQLLAQPGYFWSRRDGILIRFPVPCGRVDRRAVSPKPGLIDGDAGPVLMNDAATRKWLRRQAYIPPAMLSAFEVVTSSFPYPPRVYRAKSPASARWADFSAAREAGYYSDGFHAYLTDGPLVTETETGKVTQ